MKERILKVKDVDELVPSMMNIGLKGNKHDLYVIKAYTGDFWEISHKLNKNDMISVRFDGNYYFKPIILTREEYLEMARKHNSRLFKYKASSINLNSTFKVIEDEFLEQKLNIGILDKVEKEYLSAVIKPFRDQVDYIEKYSFDDEDEEFICITFKDDNSFSFPAFKKGAMYAGMEPLKEYTLKELGL